MSGSIYDEKLGYQVCSQCVENPRPHHPHFGHTTCFDEDLCGCEDILFCYTCSAPWPCPTKEEHIAERKDRQGEEQ